MIRLFNVFVARSVLLLLISEALLLFGCFVAAAYLSPLYLGADIYLRDEGGFGQIAIVVAIIMLGLYLLDLYEDLRRQSTTVLMQQLCLVLGGAFLVQAILGYGGIELQMPKWTMIIGSFLVLIAVPLGRRAHLYLMRKSLPPRKVVFLGTSPAVEAILERLKERPHLELQPVGYVSTGPDPAAGSQPLPWLGAMTELRDIVGRYRPECLVICDVEWKPALVEQLLEFRFAGLVVEDVATTYETVMGRVSVAELRPAQVILTREMAPRPWSVFLQRIYSFVVALVGLVVAMPVMILVGLLVRLTSPGPVLYRQRRVGLYGAPFHLYKFRSMRQDAEAATGAVWAQRKDPRVTPVGGWLRRTRLDELPQLFNVLRGEMSIVGPRPERPEFVGVLAETIPFYNQRHYVKPGITGWAQINHKYGDTIEDTVIKLEYDLYYIKYLAPALDALIMFHTIKVILLLRGSQ